MTAATLNLTTAAPPKTRVEKAAGSTTNTILITPAIVKGWKNPPFQRPLGVNEKVRALAENLKKEGGVLPGIVTLGILHGDTYLLDGQHRRESFLISGLTEGITDVRYRYFDDMADMGREFVLLNTQLRRLRPDDILKGLEGTSDALQLLRKRCPFVGYDNIRRSRSPNSPIVSMSVLLRCWYGSSTDRPVASAPSAMDIANSLTIDDAAHCSDFTSLAESAWGRDPEYGRLWSTLNLTLCAWIYHRNVMLVEPGATKLSKELFRKALTSLSSDGVYLDWLQGRSMTERDRGPCYTRIKKIFAARLRAETNKGIRLPSPAWVMDYRDR